MSNQPALSAIPSRIFSRYFFSDSFYGDIPLTFFQTCISKFEWDMIFGISHHDSYFATWHRFIIFSRSQSGTDVAGIKINFIEYFCCFAECTAWVTNSASLAAVSRSFIPVNWQLKLPSLGVMDSYHSICLIWRTWISCTTIPKSSILGPSLALSTTEMVKAWITQD